MENTSPHGGNPNADPVANFRRIVQEILHVAEESCGVDNIEQGLERALTVLQRNQYLRRQFEDELIALLDYPKEGVVELISFVMHELRWKAVEVEVDSRILHPIGNVSNLRLYEAIKDAFSDSWRDRDLYSRFHQ